METLRLCLCSTKLGTPHRFPHVIKRSCREDMAKKQLHHNVTCMSCMKRQAHNVGRAAVKTVVNVHGIENQAFFSATIQWTGS